jgi:hypothetical protein
MQPRWSERAGVICLAHCLSSCAQDLGLINKTRLDNHDLNGGCVSALNQVVPFLGGRGGRGYAFFTLKQSNLTYMVSNHMYVLVRYLHLTPGLSYSYYWLASQHVKTLGN